MVMNTRDRWISACFPALTVVLIYLLASARPDWKYERQLRSELSGLGSGESNRARLASLNQEIVLLNATRQEASAESLEVNKIWLGRARIGNLRHIADLCQQTGASLLAAKPLDKSSGMHNRTREGMKKNLEKVGWMDAQEWQLTLRGDYAAIRQIVDGLVSSGVTCLPSRIEMKTDEEPQHSHAWVLELWM